MRRPDGRSQSCGGVVGEQVLVGDDVGLGEPVGDLEAAAELAHVGDHLVGARVALVRAEDGHAAGVQGVGERLGVGDDRRPCTRWPNASSSAAAAASAATRLTWWVAASAGNTASSSGLVSVGSFQTITPDCGPRERLARAAGETSAPSRSGSWNWPPAIRPSWCAPSKNTLPPHSCDDRLDLGDRQREQGHRRAERDELRARVARALARTRRGRPRARAGRTGRRRCSGRGCPPARRGGWSCGRRPAAGSSSPCRPARSARRRRPCCRSCSPPAGARRSCS